MAISNGYFAEAGMEVEIVTGGGSDKSMTALLAGEADVALMGAGNRRICGEPGPDGSPHHHWPADQAGRFLPDGQGAGNGFDWEALRGASIIGGRPGGMPYMTLL